TYIVLRFQEHRTTGAGTLFFLWLTLHALTRVAVEFFVESPAVVGPLTLAQAANVLAAAAGIVCLVVLTRPHPEPPPTEKPALHLRRGQRVEVVVPPSPPATVAPEDISLPVVFEDEHLLVINKPAALTVHPGAGRPSGTLVNAVLARVPGLARVGSRQRPGIVHRLDKDTTGLLVVAKTSVAYASLSSQVARRTVNRTYLALVHGVLPHD